MQWGLDMQNFPHVLAEWLPFFTTLTLACATLAGLLFVALSLHAGALRSEDNINLRRLSNHTFGDFVTIMFIGLFFIAPWINPAWPAIGALITTIIALVYTGRDVWELFHAHDSREHHKYLRAHLRLRILALLLILIGAIELWGSPVVLNGKNPGLTLIFAGAVILLVSAMKSTWYLLAHELRK